MTLYNFIQLLANLLKWLIVNNRVRFIILSSMHKGFVGYMKNIKLHQLDYKIDIVTLEKIKNKVHLLDYLTTEEAGEVGRQMHKTQKVKIYNSSI